MWQNTNYDTTQNSSNGDSSDSSNSDSSVGTNSDSSYSDSSMSDISEKSSIDSRFFRAAFRDLAMFWYELDPKVKLFWKGNAMKLKIGGVNVELFSFFLGKNPAYG